MWIRQQIFPMIFLAMKYCRAQAANGMCTLRAAIEEANALNGQDTINLEGRRYTLSYKDGGSRNSLALDLSGGLHP